MPVIAYFFLTFALFLVALGVTWSFRNTAYKVQAPRHGEGTHGPASGPDGAHH